MSALIGPGGDKVGAAAQPSRWLMIAALLVHFLSFKSIVLIGLVAIVAWSYWPERVGSGVDKNDPLKPVALAVEQAIRRADLGVIEGRLYDAHRALLSGSVEITNLSRDATGNRIAEVRVEAVIPSVTILGQETLGNLRKVFRARIREDQKGQILVLDLAKERSSQIPGLAQADAVMTDTTRKGTEILGRAANWLNEWLSDGGGP